MKKKLCLIILIVLAVILTGCSNNKGKIIDISLDEFKEKINNKETFALYIGNDNCSHCNSYMPKLKKVINDYSITLYHIDNSKLTEEESGELSTYVNISGTPTIAFINNGEEESTLYRIVGDVSTEVTISKFKSNGYIK